MSFNNNPISSYRNPPLSNTYYNHQFQPYQDSYSDNNQTVNQCQQWHNSIYGHPHQSDRYNHHNPQVWPYSNYTSHSSIDQPPRLPLNEFQIQVLSIVNQMKQRTADILNNAQIIMPVAQLNRDIHGSTSLPIGKKETVNNVMSGCNINDEITAPAHSISVTPTTILNIVSPLSIAESFTLSTLHSCHDQALNVTNFECNNSSFVQSQLDPGTVSINSTASNSIFLPIQNFTQYCPTVEIVRLESNTALESFDCDRKYDHLVYPVKWDYNLFVEIGIG